MNSGWDGWDGEVVVEFAGFDERGFALGRFVGAVGCGKALEGGDVEGVELGLKAVEVAEELDRAVTGDFDDTVVGRLLRVFVDETTGKSCGHFAAVESWDFGEDSGVRLVATVFGEEDWDGCFGEIFGEDIIP